jgi:triacylglycerol esterase/lipase EstA (alpha/beta hydrolase family)
MGGLITRSYINDLMKIAPDGKPTIGNLVMLGTPNMGSPCADLMGFTFWSLGKPVKSLEQLRPKYLEGFNRAVRNRKGVKFSNLVGTSVPATCQSTVSGDGVVEIPSAIWEIGDIRYSKNVHTALTSEEDFWRLVWRKLSVSRLEITIQTRNNITRGRLILIVNPKTLCNSLMQISTREPNNKTLLPRLKIRKSIWRKT